MEKKKILFVMPDFGVGGAEKSLLTLLFELSKCDDIRVDLMFFKTTGMYLKQIPKDINILETEKSVKKLYSSLKTNRIASAEDLKYCLIRLLGTICSAVLTLNGRRQKQLRWKLFYKNAINEFDKEYDYACGFLDGEAVYYVIDKVKAKKKYIWNQNEYGKLGRGKRKYDLPYFKKADRIITLSEKNYDSLRDNFPDQIHKVEIIPPIVSPEMIENCAREFEPEEYKNASGTIMISVGRMVDAKGFDLAVDAGKILKDKGVDYSWYIVGDGEKFKEIGDRIISKGLEDRFFLLGERENPYPYIDRADIFVQPSRYEGKSVVLTETKFLCKPIIVTAYETAPDQITNGVNGMIVDLDPGAIAEGIERIIDSDISLVYEKNLREELPSDRSETEKYLKLFGE